MFLSGIVLMKHLLRHIYVISYTIRIKQQSTVILALNSLLCLIVDKLVSAKATINNGREYTNHNLDT